MESNIFDEVTKALATSTTRRQALRRIGGILGGTALAGLFPGLFPGLALANNSDAAHFCNAVFDPGPDRGQCKSDAAHGTGLYYNPDCGGNPQSVCCPTNPDGTCTSYSNATCCGSGQTCTNGTCVAACTPSNVPNGGPCTLDCNCSSGVCDTYTFTCGCRPQFGPCVRDVECCSGGPCLNVQYYQGLPVAGYCAS